MTSQGNHTRSILSNGLSHLHIPFNFITLFQPWDAQVMKGAIQAYHAAMPPGATPNFVFGNHGLHPLVTRFGPENRRSPAMLLLALWGIPTMYYGDELGMEDTFAPIDRLQDPLGISKPDLNIGRDPGRTPMHSDASPNACFSPGVVQTWLPVAQDYETVIVVINFQGHGYSLDLSEVGSEARVLLS